MAEINNNGAKLKLAAFNLVLKMKSEIEKRWPEDFAKLIEDMCCQSLCYKKEVKVEGMLAVTIDQNDVMIVKVSKHHKGKNDRFVIPKFSVTDDPSPFEAEPILSRLFGNINPAHVSVTGLGSSKLVGELVITSCATAGKIPQAKLILNEQMPIMTKNTSSSSVMYQGTSQTQKNQPLVTHSLDASSENVNLTPEQNDNTSAIKSGFAAAGAGGSIITNVLNSSALATKKSLNSVIAKLHHQTSSGSTGSTEKSSDKNQQPLSIAGKTKVFSGEIHATEHSKSPVVLKKKKTNDILIEGVEQMDIEAVTEQRSIKDASKSYDIKAASGKNNSAKIVQMSSNGKQPKNLHSPKAEIVATSAKIDSSEDSTPPPLKRQRVESSKYTQFKESLKHKDISKATVRDGSKSPISNSDPLKDKVFVKENVSGKTTLQEKELQTQYSGITLQESFTDLNCSKKVQSVTEKTCVSDFVSTTAIQTKKEAVGVMTKSGKVALVRSTPIRDSVSSTGSQRSTPTRESSRLQKKATPKSENTQAKASSQKKRTSARTAVTPNSSATPPVRTTAKVKRFSKGGTTPNASLKKSEVDESSSSTKEAKFAMVMSDEAVKSVLKEQLTPSSKTKKSNTDLTTPSSALRSKGKEDLNDSIRSRPKRVTQEEPTTVAIAVPKARKINRMQTTQSVFKTRTLNEGKSKLTAIKNKGKFNKDDAVKKSLRLARKVDSAPVSSGVKKNPRVKRATSAQVKKGVFKVVSSKVSTAHKRGAAQAQAKKIVEKSRQHAKRTVSKLEADSKRTRRMCEKCSACKRKEDCGSCLYCLDKPKYGGSNTLRQKCATKQCKVYGLTQHKA